MTGRQNFIEYCKDKGYGVYSKYVSIPYNSTDTYVKAEARKFKLFIQYHIPI